MGQSKRRNDQNVQSRAPAQIPRHAALPFRETLAVSGINHTHCCKATGVTRTFRITRRAASR
jgi:hypothetical protein